MKTGSVLQGEVTSLPAGDQAKGSEMKGNEGFERNGEFQIRSSRLSSKALKDDPKWGRGERRKGRKKMRSFSGEKVKIEAWCPRRRAISVNGRPGEH